MKKVSLLNHKGGVGKSTIAVNIAAYYANTGSKTLLCDLDCQQSSYNWQMVRPKQLPKIGILEIDFSNGFKIKNNTNNANYAIIDTPAGLISDYLESVIKISDKIIIPVKSSSFDIQSSSTFILEVRKIMERFKKPLSDLSIIGNAYTPDTQAQKQLKEFIDEQGLNNPANIPSSQLYVNLTGLGISIFDSNNEQLKKEKDNWSSLFQWIDN